MDEHFATGKMKSNATVTKKHLNSAVFHLMFGVIAAVHLLMEKAQGG